MNRNKNKLRTILLMSIFVTLACRTTGCIADFGNGDNPEVNFIGGGYREYDRFIEFKEGQILYGCTIEVEYPEGNKYVDFYNDDQAKLRGKYTKEEFFELGCSGLIGGSNGVPDLTEPIITTCPADQILQNGQCQSCPDGKKAVNNQCVMPSILGGRVSYCVYSANDYYFNLPFNSGPDPALNPDPAVVKTELENGNLTVVIGNAPAICTVDAANHLLSCSFPKTTALGSNPMINVLDHGQVIDVIPFNVAACTEYKSNTTGGGDDAPPLPPPDPDLN